MLLAMKMAVAVKIALVITAAAVVALLVIVHCSHHQTRYHPLANVDDNKRLVTFWEHCYLSPMGMASLTTAAVDEAIARTQSRILRERS